MTKPVGRSTGTSFPRPWFRWVLLSLFGLATPLLAAGPYRPEAVHKVVVSWDGKYLAMINLEGDLRVVDLGTREFLFQPPRGGLRRRDAIHSVNFAAFDSPQERLIWNCGYGQVCWRRLITGEQGMLLEHDPQDDVHAGIVSVDGSRMAFGTAGGRLFTFDTATGEQREFKPRDVWSANTPLPIFTLAGTPSLDYFVSATSFISPLLERFDFGEDWKVRVRPDQRRVLIKYSGIVVWSWAGDTPREIYDGFQDRIRAAFAPDGGRLLIRQETQRWQTYGLPDLLHEQTAFPLLHPASGVTFLDSGGRFLGMVSYSKRKLEVYDLGNGEPIRSLLQLRRQPAPGMKPIAALPDRGWLFVGLAHGGVDWYRYSPENPVSLQFVARLR